MVLAQEEGKNFVPLCDSCSLGSLKFHFHLPCLLYFKFYVSCFLVELSNIHSNVLFFLHTYHVYYLVYLKTNFFLFLEFSITWFLNLSFPFQLFRGTLSMYLFKFSKLNDVLVPFYLFCYL